MNYLYFFKYIYTITNNYDLQILIYDLIKTKQIKDKIHNEMKFYFLEKKKKMHNIFMLFVLPNIILFKNFNNNNNLKKLVKLNEKYFFNTVHIKVLMILDNYGHIFEDSYIYEIINNNVIVHPFFMNIIIDRLLFNYPYRSYKSYSNVYNSNCIQLENMRVMYHKLHYTKLISI